MNTEDDLFFDEVFLRVASAFEQNGGFFDSTWMTDHEWNLWRDSILIERERGFPLETIIGHATSRAARRVLAGRDAVEGEDLEDSYFWTKEKAEEYTDDDQLWTGTGEVA